MTARRPALIVCMSISLASSGAWSKPKTGEKPSAPAQQAPKKERSLQTLKANKPSDSTPLETAQSDGYKGRPNDLKPGSVLGGAIALIPGSFIHGLGLFYLREHSTGWALLISEILGLGLMASAYYLKRSGRKAAEVSRLLSHTGIIVFTGSWLADIIGTFKGTAPLSTGDLRRQTPRFGLAYRYTDNELMPFNHHISTHFNLNFGPAYVRPGLDLEVGLKRREILVDTGVWVFVGKNAENFVSIGTLLNRTENQTDSWARNSVLTYVEWQVDVGRVIQTLRRFYVYSRIGYGFARYQFGQSDDDAPGLFADGALWDNWLHLETGLALFAVETTHLSLSLVQTPMSRVPPASLVDVGIFSPELEALKFDLRYGYATDVGIHVQVLGGDGFGAWLGLEYAL